MFDRRTTDFTADFTATALSIAAALAAELRPAPVPGSLVVREARS